MALTTYERARLRLRAFALLDGWGVVNEKGVHVPHTLERRKEIAEEFVEWAISEPSLVQSEKAE